MTRRGIWLALLPIGLLAIGAIRAADPDAPNEPLPAPKLAASYSGVGGCSASGCHGSAVPRSQKGGEFTTWATADPHSRAYAVLANDLSRQMTKLLGRKEPAYRDQLCLQCHAPMCPQVEGPGAEDFRSDAVGCEACHGASSAYRTEHFRAGWNRRGMAPTKSLVDRVGECAKCHIGSRDRQVDHDLIAAGHPRLLFEYASYHEQLPRHWQGEEGPFVARAWAIGQVTAALAAVELLEHQASRPAKWPELTAFNCYACHHDLAAGRQPSSGADVAGSLSYGSWNFAMLGLLSTHGKTLGAAYAPPSAVDASRLLMLTQKAQTPPAEIAAEARALAGSLRQWRDQLRSAADPSADAVAQFLVAVRGDDAAKRGWEPAAQQFLALRALDRAYPVAGRREKLNGLRQSLLFPRRESGSRFNSPAAFSTEGYAEQFKGVAW